MEHPSHSGPTGTADVTVGKWLVLGNTPWNTHRIRDLGICQRGNVICDIPVTTGTAECLGAGICFCHDQRSNNEANSEPLAIQSQDNNIITRMDKNRPVAAIAGQDESGTVRWQEPNNNLDKHRSATIRSLGKKSRAIHVPGQITGPFVGHINHQQPSWAIGQSGNRLLKQSSNRAIGHLDNRASGHRVIGQMTLPDYPRTTNPPQQNVRPRNQPTSTG